MRDYLELIMAGRLVQNSRNIYIYIYTQRNANANSTSQNLESARYINMQSRNTNCTKIEN